MAAPIPLTEEEFRLLAFPLGSSDWNAIQTEPLQRHCPLDNGRLPPHTAPSSIGALGILPTEVIQMTLNTLDLQTLTDFRAVSWRARSLVDSFPIYNAIVQHVPDILRALLSTHMAVNYTAPDIYDVLCRENCSACGQYGIYLDLFTGHRFCRRCTNNLADPNLFCMTAQWAKKKFGISQKAMQSLPTLLSLPVEEEKGRKGSRRRTSLVPVEKAAAAGSYKLSALQMMNLHWKLRTVVHREQHLMGSIRFPVLDRGTGKLDWGWKCLACRWNPKAEWFASMSGARFEGGDDRIYSASGYKEHFQMCPLSKIARGVASEYIVPAGEHQDDLTWRFYIFLRDYQL